MPPISRPRLLPSRAAAAVNVLSAVAAGLLAWPVIGRTWRVLDTSQHLQWALDACYGTGWGAALRARPHMLYQVLICAALHLAPRNASGEPALAIAARAVAVLSWSATVAAIAIAMRRQAGPPSSLGQAVARGALALALLIATPLSLLAGPGFYLGYMPLVAYHNPTILLLRPFAIGLFALIVPLLAIDTSPARARAAAALVALVVLGMLAKPSYAMALLPALAITLFWQPTLRPTAGRRALLLWVALPAVACFAAQALLYLQPGGIRWAPLEVELGLLHAAAPEAGAGALAWRLLLSLLFPLALLVLYPGAARRDRALRLAWLAFAAGLALSYLLAERAKSGCTAISPGVDRSRSSCCSCNRPSSSCSADGQARGSPTTRARPPPGPFSDCMSRTASVGIS